MYRWLFYGSSSEDDDYSSGENIVKVQRSAFETSKSDDTPKVANPSPRAARTSNYPLDWSVCSAEPPSSSSLLFLKQLYFYLVNSANMRFWESDKVIFSIKSVKGVGFSPEKKPSKFAKYWLRKDSGMSAFLRSCTEMSIYKYYNLGISYIAYKHVSKYYEEHLQKQNSKINEYFYGFQGSRGSNRTPTSFFADFQSGHLIQVYLLDSWLFCPLHFWLGCLLNVDSHSLLPGWAS